MNDAVYKIVPVYEIKTARRSLNLLLADWANRGLNQWTIKQQSKAVAATTTSLTDTDLFGTTTGDAAQIIDITDLVIQDSNGNDLYNDSDKQSYLLELYS